MVYAKIIAGLRQKLSPERTHALDADEVQVVTPFLKTLIDDAFLIMARPLEHAPHSTIEFIINIHARADDLESALTGNS